MPAVASDHQKRLAGEVIHQKLLQFGVFQFPKLSDNETARSHVVVSGKGVGFRVEGVGFRA